MRKGRSKTHDRLRINLPLLAGYELIHNRMEFWHPTNEPVIGRKSGQPVRVQKNSFDLPKKETLNPQVLEFVKIGTERAVKYLQLNYIDSPFKIDRSGKDVSLTKILATTLDRKCELKKMMDRVVSLSEEDLDRAMNKEEAGEELAVVLDALNFELSPPLPKLIPIPTLSQLNKSDRIEKLIEYWRMYFEKDKVVKSRLEQSARKEFEERYPAFTTESRLKGLHVEKIYCLSDEIMGES